VDRVGAARRFTSERSEVAAEWWWM
jgi:hypothetical protein